jgi:hypothetical protein
MDWISVLHDVWEAERELWADVSWIYTDSSPSVLKNSVFSEVGWYLQESGCWGFVREDIGLGEMARSEMIDSIKL